MYVRVGRGFNMVKMILNNLRHRKLCARRVPQMVMSHHKQQRVQVCIILLQGYETMGDSYLTAASLEIRPWYTTVNWSEYGSMWILVSTTICWRRNSGFRHHRKKIFSIFQNRRGAILVDILEQGTDNSACDVETLKKLKSQTARDLRRNKNCSFSTTVPGHLTILKRFLL